METIIAKTGWDRYQTYFDVFEDTRCDRGMETSTPGESIGESQRQLINAIGRQVEALAAREDLASYFREVTRHALFNYFSHLSNRAVDLKPMDVANSNPWIIDTRGRATRGFLPTANSPTAINHNMLLYGAIPSIPVCWVPLQEESYSTSNSLVVSLPDGLMNDSGFLDTDALKSGCIDVSERRWTPAGRVEVFEAAEIRIGLAPKNDWGHAGLVFEVFSRRLMCIGNRVYLTELEPDHFARLLGLIGASEALPGLPVDGTLDEILLVHTVGDGQSIACKETEEALDRLVYPAKIVGEFEVNYLRFDADMLEALLVETAHAEWGVVSAYPVPDVCDSSFPPAAPAADLQRSLVDRVGRQSRFVYDLERRVNEHLKALGRDQSRRAASLSQLFLSNSGD